MKKTVLTTIVSLAISSLFASSVFADENAVSNLLKEKYPELPAATVQQSKAPNLYQVKIDNHVIYTNENADYLFVGGSVLTKEGSQTIKLAPENQQPEKTKDVQKPSVTPVSANTVEQTNQKDSYFGDSKIFSNLPFERAVKLTYGNGGDKDKIYAIFEDPDCPYCQTIEKNFADNADRLNMTAYLFYMPLNIHPGAKEKAEFLWCQKDQEGAWKSWMAYTASHPIDGTIQEQVEKRWEDWKKESGFTSTSPDCDKSVVQKNYDMAHGLGFAQTPMIIYKNSTRQPNVITAEKMLGNFEAVKRFPKIEQIESLPLPEVLKDK